MNKVLFNGNNFYLIKQDKIEFWGMNIEKPFGVLINYEIKKFINQNGFSTNEVCEFIDEIDYELFKLCYSYRSDLNSNDGRIILMNKLLDIGLDKQVALIIALDAGSSQVIVNREYLKDYDLSDKTRKKIIKELCNFYMG